METFKFYTTVEILTNKRERVKKRRKKCVKKKSKQNEGERERGRRAENQQYINKMNL
jgi:hypothetical protein